MSDLIFSEEALYQGNIFQFEERLQSQANRYIEGGGILTTYFSQDVNVSTVDRGTQDVDELFGDHAPLRYHQINNFPLYGFPQANPENTDEQQIEDITVEGDCQILPSTIVPRQNDFFLINHMKMLAIFQVTTVNYDSMKPNGYYKIHYRLVSTEQEELEKIKRHCLDEYHTELNAIGTSTNPIIKEDDYVYRQKIIKMTNAMIQSYRAMYYNEKHNCFLYYDQQSGRYLYDLCGHEFMAKYSLMNMENSHKVIVLSKKIHDTQFPLYYNNSVYNWIELDAPIRMLQKFPYMLIDADGYPYSSFATWHEDVDVIIPIAPNQSKGKIQAPTFFDESQVNGFDSTVEPNNEYEKLIWKFIHQRASINIHDVSLYTGDALMNCVRHIDTFLYTPIVVYIIRFILGLN